MEELGEGLLEDILNHIDCRPWAEMKLPGSELEDWYIWYGFGDEP